MRCFFLFLNFAFFISNVASIGFSLPSVAVVGSSTPVAWTREDSDAPSLIFDLRFVQGDADVGLALANIEMGEEDEGGDVWVTFPSAGNYVLKAVTGPLNTLVGTSNEVSAYLGVPDQAPFPVSTGTVSSTPTASSTSSSSTAGSPTSSATSSTSQPTPSNTTSSLQTIKSSPNLPAIAGGVVGALLILSLLAFLFVFLGRRRAAFKQRISFHKDMMVQRRQSRMMASLPSLPTQSQLSVSITHANADVEQGLPSASSIVPRPLGSGHVVPSPIGPRASRPSTIKRTQHTIVTSRPTTPVTPATAPRTRRQKQIADRIKMLTGQMAEMQQRPDSEHILDEMQREMVWLRDHEHSPWAMGLTDVPPPGHSRYMTP